ncbi:hypothetical protein ABMZ32_19175, partial [Escherichia coli]|nr:hypothetical protein [Escherichia coli]
ADRNRSHWSTSKTPSYTKSVSWQHHQVDRSFGDIPLVHGMPFISGVGIEALQNKILTILQG